MDVHNRYHMHFLLLKYTSIKTLINIWPGMINTDYDISVYNNIINYLLWNILILLPKCLAFPHLGQSMWEDYVTTTKIRHSHMHKDPPDKGFMSGLIMLISIGLFVCYTEWLWHLFTIIFSIIYCGTFLILFYLAILHLGQSREDKVTATKIRTSSTLTKTLRRGSSWVD